MAASRSTDANRRGTTTAEARLLFLCAGGPSNDERIRELIQAGLDWNRLVGLAERERATGPVWRRVRRVASPEIAAPLQPLGMVSDFRMMQLEGRLGEILDHLHGAGIDPVVLKGGALAIAVFPEFRDRPMGDLDLLVRREELDAALQVVRAAGWDWNPWTAAAERYETHHHARPLLDTQGSLKSIEVHTDLFPPGHPFEISADGVRERAHQHDWAGRRVWVPDEYDMLLHACLHFAWSHRMQDGAWRTVLDVITLTTRPGFDWDVFTSRMHSDASATSCYWTLRMTEMLGDVAFPERVLAALRPRASDALLRMLERHFVLNSLPSGENCPSETLLKFMWNAAVQPKRSGHGSSRPWDYEERPTDSASHDGAGNGAGDFMSRSAKRYAKIARDFARYARAMLWGASAIR
jgi:hypothetical protein